MEATLKEFYDDIDLQCHTCGSNNVAGVNHDGGGDVNPISLLADNKTEVTDKTKKMPDKKYFTNDGKIDTVTLRTGPNLSSAFNKRSGYLMQKAREIHQVTGCAITITIKPLTDRAKKENLHFQSDNYETYTPRRLMTKNRQTDLVPCRYQQTQHRQHRHK